MGGKLFLAVLFSGFLFVVLIITVVTGPLMPIQVTVEDIPLRNALWEHRALDVMGLLALLLTATYGVLVLIRERR